MKQQQKTKAEVETRAASVLCATRQQSSDKAQMSQEGALIGRELCDEAGNTCRNCRLPCPHSRCGGRVLPQSLILTGVYQDVRYPGEQISVCGKTTGMYHSDDTFAHTEPGSQLV